MSHVKLDLAGFTAVRRSPAAVDAVRTEAERVAARARQLAAGECQDPSHAMFTAIDPRASEPGTVALVTTGGDALTIAHNLKHNTLVKAMGGS